METGMTIEDGEASAETVTEPTPVAADGGAAEVNAKLDAIMAALGVRYAGGDADE